MFPGMQRTPPTASGIRSPGTNQAAGRRLRQAILPLALLSTLLAGPASACSAPGLRATCMESGQACNRASTSCAAAHRCCRARAGIALAAHSDRAPLQGAAATPNCPDLISPKPAGRWTRPGSPRLTAVPLFLWTRVLLI